MKSELGGARSSPSGAGSMLSSFTIHNFKSYRKATLKLAGYDRAP